MTLRSTDFFLVRHPASAENLVRAVSAETVIAAPEALRVVFRVLGDMQSLQIPAGATPGREDQLWRHTCFEVFLRDGDGRYFEFNFSPSTKWAAYCFDSYRRGMREWNLASSPHINFELAANSCSLDATIDLRGMPDIDTTFRLRLGLAAVIEDADGRISYWALAHPPGKPDFHHADSFVGVLQDNVD